MNETRLSAFASLLVPAQVRSLADKAPFTQYSIAIVAIVVVPSRIKSIP